MQIDGNVVARLRWSRGISRGELAAKTGLSGSTISDIERGRSRGSPRTARLIARALDIAADVIITKGSDDDTGTEAQVG